MTRKIEPSAFIEVSNKMMLAALTCGLTFGSARDRGRRLRDRADASALSDQIDYSADEKSLQISKA
jgi:hypothetical protein